MVRVNVDTEEEGETLINSSFLEDIFGVYLNIFNNVLSLSLFIVGVGQLTYLAATSKSDFLDPFVTLLRDLVKNPDTPKFVLGVTSAVINLLLVMIKHRRYLASQYIGWSIIFVSRVNALLLIVTSIAFVLNVGLTQLKQFVLSQTWMVYSSTNFMLNKFIIVVVVFVVWFFGLMDLSKNAATTANFKKILKEQIRA